MDDLRTKVSKVEKFNARFPWRGLHVNLKFAARDIDCSLRWDRPSICIRIGRPADILVCQRRGSITVESDGDRGEIKIEPSWFRSFNDCCINHAAERTNYTRQSNWRIRTAIILWGKNRTIIYLGLFGRAKPLPLNPQNVWPWFVEVFLSKELLFFPLQLCHPRQIIQPSLLENLTSIHEGWAVSLSDREIT